MVVVTDSKFLQIQKAQEFNETMIKPLEVRSNGLPLLPADLEGYGKAGGDHWRSHMRAHLRVPISGECVVKRRFNNT